MAKAMDVAKKPMNTVMNNKKTADGKRQSTLILLPQLLARPSGTPLNALVMSKVLRDNGFKVHILTIGEVNLRIEGCRVHRLPVFYSKKPLPVGFSLRKLIYNVTFCLLLPVIILRNRIDIVHAIEESAFYGVPLARLLGRVAITDLDSDLPAQLDNTSSRLANKLAGPAALLRQKAISYSHLVIAVSPYVYELSRKECGTTPVQLIQDIPIEEVLRAPDVSVVEELRRSHKLAGSRTIVYTGNLEGRQGISLLLEAMVELRRTHSSLKLLIVGGSAPELQRFEQYISELNLSGTVLMLGQFPPEKMPEFMALADVLVSPRLEPFVTPLKIFSYMASGKVIVATDLPTHRAVLDEHSAVLVNPTASDLAKGVSIALADSEASAKRASQAKELLRNKHNLYHFSHSLVEAYQKAISQKKQD